MRLSKGRGAQSDGSDTNAQQPATRRLTSTAQILIIYFSRTGNTEWQAQKAQKRLMADSYYQRRFGLLPIIRSMIES
ncbi:flavodoxin family protein [Lactobacillus sp. DCY120]|uniref:Flavodoxin family protein n=1 Tax=Bombilactobacillus apium TaxID=2675299 RepID=A0A850RC61_9LACO|nr:flavodoxin family protein [Bombilactobacillus apium]NVY96378.1 flavodoxin family protein [Bombilactobacillus apium]